MNFTKRTSLLSLSLVLLAACGTPPPPVEPEPPVTPPTTVPDEQARAAFAEAYAAYEAAEADGELGPQECASVAEGFDAVHRSSGLQIARFNSAVIHERCGQLDEALVIYRELAEQGYHLALNNLGVIAWEQGDSGEALSLFQRSVEADEVAAFHARNNLAAAHRDRYANKLEAGDFATA